MYNRLKKLIGLKLDALGADQERNRGYKLHSKICEILGYSTFTDDGSYPDITHQLIEVKLQTSPTIDLGLVTPDDVAPLDIPNVSGVKIRHCDVRYAIVKAVLEGDFIIVEKVFLTTGERFFNYFPRFEGRVLK